MNKKLRKQVLEKILEVFEKSGAQTMDDLRRKDLNTIGDIITDMCAWRANGDKSGCVIKAYDVDIKIYHHGAYTDYYHNTITNIYINEDCDDLTVELLKQEIATLLNESDKIINLTPHTVNIGDIVLHPSGTIARAKEEVEVVGNINGIDIVRKRFTDVVDLPDYQDGVYYVVSLIVAQALPERKDLLCPGEQIRDEQGRIIGCKNLCII